MIKRISSFWWLWLPLIFLTFQLLAEIFLPQKLLSALHSENGPYELLQFAVLVLATFLSARLLTSCLKDKDLWLSLWAFAAFAGCFYVAGEEISWGQQFFAWSTPESWMSINDQGETNLHNTTSWLDQKPRLILLAGIIGGGLIIPLLKKFSPTLVPSRFETIYPPVELALVAGIALVLKIADKIGGFYGIAIFERISEVEELFMYYFVLLYIHDFRIKKKAP